MCFYDEYFHRQEVASHAFVGDHDFFSGKGTSASGFLNSWPFQSTRMSPTPIGPPTGGADPAKLNSDAAPILVRRGNTEGRPVRFHGEPGEIEFVAETIVGDPLADWNLGTHGPGVMVVEPKFFGRAYIRDTEQNEDLEFVGRKEVS